MRTDIIWPVVWGTCFVGGVILGSTGPVNVLAFGSSSPKLRGSGHVTEKVVSEKNVVQQRQLQLQQDDGVTAEARALGSSDFDAAFDEDRRVEAGGYGDGAPSTVAQRIRALNGGLWGPNEEEEKEIALELARLREESFRAPSTSSSEGAGGNDRYEPPLSLHSSYSFEYDFEAGGTSYSYDFDFEFPLY